MASSTPVTNSRRRPDRVKPKVSVPRERGRRHAWIREHLYVAVVCDILDELGHRDQAMHQRLRPLDPENCVIAGRARTFR